MSESYEMDGTVKEIMDEVTYASGFKKREFVVTNDDDKFPQDIKFDCVKDKAALLDSLNIGDRVKVTFNLRGNNKNSSGRYFVNLPAWKVDVQGVGTAGAEPEQADDSGLDSMPF